MSPARKSPPAGKKKPPSSPGRKPYLSPPRKIKKETPTKKTKGGAPQLYVVAFEKTFTCEAYYYNKANGEENYTYGLKSYIREAEHKMVSADVDKMNIVRVVDRRQPNTDNEKMPSAPNSQYSRSLFLRYPPENKSTPETRKEGLRLLTNFFKDGRFSQYPPPSIQTHDLTNEDDPAALDEYFTDGEIYSIMDEDVASGVLNNEFCAKMPDFARYCWKYNHFSGWARDTLGFSAFEEDSNVAS